MEYTEEIPWEIKVFLTEEQQEYIELCSGNNSFEQFKIGDTKDIFEKEILISDETASYITENFKAAF
jgi:hypothetical protein